MSPEAIAGHGRKPATEHTARRNREALASLPPDDEQDFADATRGLIAPFDPPIVETDNGRTAWELQSYEFLDADAPTPRTRASGARARLSRIAGLFEIAPGFYQLRGFDLSNMHVVEGEEGIVVIDPLVSAETAAAALALYREHRGERPVTGLIYTHSHVDHFGGAKGIVSQEEIEARSIPVLAPAGFLHHAVSENVFAGTAMGRRAGYMYGALLERGPDGQVGSGLGQTTSLGTITLIPANLDVTETGQEEVVDGVRMAFQLTPGTEAPAEMNIHFPDSRVLCIADNAARAMHNILTPRGALVRDPRVWAHYLDEAIELFGRDSDVLFSAAPLALLGHRADRRLPGEAARPLPLPPRPDPAPAQPGPHRAGDRRADRAAPEPRPRVALPRVLRLGQPQREGDLPALHGLVRRQPRPPLGAPAGRAGAPLRRVDGRRRRGAGEGPRGVRGRRLPLGRRGGQPPRLRRAGEPGGARAAGGRARATRLRRRERDLAQLLPDGREGAARGNRRDADRDRPAGHRRPPLGQPAARRDGDPPRRAARLGASTCGSTGSSPTPTSSTRSRSATGC